MLENGGRAREGFPGTHPALCRMNKLNEGCLAVVGHREAKAAARSIVAASAGNSGVISD